jgi:glycosyltransferase involved in cell wall biosynthesis
MNDSKTVSVVIPTFRRSIFLKKAIKSVHNQTFKDYDIIVVDDNIDPDEIDKVKIICDAYKVTYIKNNRTKGGCGSRNSGILVSESKYIAFLDDDDFWYPEKLKYQVEHMNSGLISSCYVAFSKNYINQNIKSINKSSLLNKSYLSRNNILKGTCPASTSLVMADRLMLIESGLFDESLESFQDYDMWIRLTAIKPMSYIDKVLAEFTFHQGDRVSVNLYKRFNALDLIILKWGNEIEKVCELSKFRNHFQATAYASNALAQTGPSYIRMVWYRFLVLYKKPLSLNSWLNLLVSIFGSKLYWYLKKIRSNKYS